jgi:dephospho-CoA kinase
MSFGIGVYPCLIPSMEKLTNRGIALASKFRGMGLEVIESYPGVAQDVLGIHRKQKGLEHLKASYKNFGIAGDYLHQPRIAHDELDAIASALVGLFYISGQYTALGNADENYLYVPNVVPYAKNPVVIGITGEIGAGKTTLSEYLCFKHGFRSMRYSEVIQKLYDCDNNRNTLQNIGREIAGDPIRQQQLSLEIIKEIEAHPNRHYVIDGIRQKVDFETLSTYFDKNFFLLYIKAPFNKMLQRYNKRGAEKIDKAEFNKIVSDKVEEDISQFMGYCYTNNNIITNDKTFKEYFESIDSKVKEILCQ